MTPPRRVFIGWDGPVLERAAAWLVEHRAAEGVIDLGRVLVAVPVARAGRWLGGMLVDLAAQRGALLVPPRTVTLARIPDELLAGARAPGAARVAAWREALRREPEAASLIAPVGDPWSWASALQRSADALGAQGASFEDAARAGGGLDEDERTRLRSCAALERAYRDELETAKLHDLVGRPPAPRERMPAEAVLVAPPELAGLARTLLDEHVAGITTLIAAPEPLANRFDEWGTPIPSAWADAALPIASDAIRFADDPDDQARAAWECVASVDPAPSAREVSIGVLDAASASAVTRIASEQGVRTRDAAGRPVRLTAIGALLQRLAEHWESATLDTLRALVRHPHVERALGCSRRLKHLDEYAARTELRALPDSLEDWPVRIRREGEAVDAIVRGLESLLEPVRPGEERSLAARAASIVEVLQNIYAGREFDPTTPAGRADIAALDAVTACARALRSSSTRCDASEACGLIASQIGERPVPPDPGESAVELLGWLELATDPAPLCVVCDASEGRLPSRVGVDPLIPQGLGERLGLATDADRAGRDAYLAALIASSKRRAWFVAIARTQEGNPLPPSRLLFRGSDEDVLDRLRRSTAGGRDPMRTTRLAAPPPVEPVANGFAPMLVAKIVPPTRWPVTRFRTYLSSPYAFYVTTAITRREAREHAGELTPATFGDLIHDALRRFGEDAQASTFTDEGQVADAMVTFLDDASRAVHGDDRPAAIWLQVEQARMRLRRFAKAQAAWARDGWRTIHAEWSPGRDGQPFDVDGEPIALTGKIDRIDVNQQDPKRFAIIDYKTGKEGKTPDQTHRGDEGWRDLQLPLYRTLASTLGVGAEPVLAFALLPPDETTTGFSVAKWSAEELEDAETCARTIARRVRTGEYIEIGERPITRGVLGALGGFGLIDTGETAEEGAS